MEVIEGSGEIVPEPDWRNIFDDVLDVAAASEHWGRVSRELRDRTLLSPVNAHAMQRLVIAYIVYDRAARDVASQGAVTKPRRGNTKAIARVSPHFTVMREAAADAASLEAELGVSPRRRSSATKVDNARKTSRPADRFLRPVSK
jgi:P27 family predicted phage terminase small subunit